MLRIFKVAELEAKKHALAAESEAYRQTIRFDIHNLRLRASHTKRKFNKFSGISPLLPLLMPLARAYLAGRGRQQRKGRSGMMRVFGAGFLALQIYRKFGPLINQFLSRRRDQEEFEHAPFDEPAGDITR